MVSDIATKAWDFGVSDTQHLVKIKNRGQVEHILTLLGSGTGRWNWELETGRSELGTEK